MKDRDRKIINKVTKYIERADQVTRGMDLRTFQDDWIIQSAAAFSLAQIGKLAKNISEESERENTQIIWREIRNLRNRIVHDYASVDLELLWEILTEDIPELSRQIKILLNELSDT